MGCDSQEKYWFVARICFICKLVEYTNDSSTDALIVSKILYKFLQLKLHQIFSGKITFKLISTTVLREKYMSKISTKETKPKQGPWSKN